MIVLKYYLEDVRVEPNGSADAADDVAWPLLRLGRVGSRSLG